MGVLMSACTPGLPEEMQPAQTGTLEGTLRPYPSDTPTTTPLPTDYVSPTPSPTITPTATQVFYEILLGDDMYSIAFRYGLSPQEIMTANPEVNPYAMTVGESLLIPITPQPELTQTAIAAADVTPELTPTTAPLLSKVQDPDCYPDALGGLWCFILVQNEESEALENISAVVTLDSGDETRQETAILPLNLLPAGESLPLITYFNAPIPAQYQITAEVDFLLPVMPDDQRYLTVEIMDQSVSFERSGRVAEVSGILSLSSAQDDAAYVWVSATALDEAGRVVAYRRWDSLQGLAARSELPFELSLYSLAGPIDRVELLVEAQPVRSEVNEE